MVGVSGAAPCSLAWLRHWQGTMIVQVSCSNNFFSLAFKKYLNFFINKMNTYAMAWEI